MQVLIGGLLGLAAGWAASLAAGWFAARYEPRSRRPLARALAMAGLAAWGAWAAWRGGRLEMAAAAVVTAGLLLALSLVDFRVRRLPDPLVLALLAWALVQALWLGRPTLSSLATGLLVGGALFLLVAALQRGAMGAGDVKLAAALGALLGFPSILSALLLGAVAGGLAALFFLLTRRLRRKDPMAYGPYLAFGAWLIWARDAALLAWPALAGGPG